MQCAPQDWEEICIYAAHDCSAKERKKGKE
eukprot:SAG31_NODE_7143_length_1778_cov_1.355569_3_plen_29_part_01